jgi:AcrR family transcriptional regulator
MKKKQNSPLTQEDWFQVGLEALANSGREALRAAKLARILGVTTGSFYWHFDCLAEFRSGLLDYWREAVVVGLIRAAKERRTDPLQILAELRKLIIDSGAHQYDAAMRNWGRTDPLVQDTVNSADEIRLAFLMETIRSTGVSKEDARKRAHLIGAAWRGSQEMTDPDYRMQLIDMAASE